MDHILYETHLNGDGKLPFIFRDSICLPQDHYVANWHKNIEILHFLKGSGYVICDSITTQVAEGDIFIVNSCCLHLVECDPCGLQYQCLIVDRDFCAANDINTDNLIFEERIRDRDICEMFLAIAKEFKVKSDFVGAGIRASVLSLMVSLCRKYVVKSVKYNQQSNADIIENIKLGIGYIHAHFGEKMTVDDIAAEAMLSKYHFSREFKKMTGYTVVSYILLVRCRQAKKLLHTGKYSVSQVCFLCGFDNSSYFSKTFKKITGVLPSKIWNK